MNWLRKSKEENFFAQTDCASLSTLTWRGVVTGTNRGRGFAVCRQLAEAGMQVYLGRRELSEGERAAHELQQQG